jgi:GNAT superfamily N-acetyltransferase
MIDQAPSAPPPHVPPPPDVSPTPHVAEVTIRRPATLDTGAVLAMLGRCSRASLYHRFHGVTDGVAYFTALLRDRPANRPANRPADRTLLAWHGSACVAVASLGAGPTGIDLGVLVEDAWQRHGIGTCLIRHLLDAARSEGVTTVHADVMTDDAFILRALRRVAPLTVSTESGSFLITIDVSRQPGRPSADRR